MSIPASQLVESLLSLPQAERADLALQLLQSLTPPGEEISDEALGQQLHERVQQSRAGEVTSSSLDEARAAIEQSIAKRPNR